MILFKSLVFVFIQPKKCFEKGINKKQVRLMVHDLLILNNLMFKWLRNKMIKGSENEFRKCVDMCHTFIKFAEGQEMLNPTPIDIGAKFDYPNISIKLDYMSDQLAGLNQEGYSPQTMSKLLDLDMECRRLWAIAYGGSDLKYNKTFDLK